MKKLFSLVQVLLYKNFPSVYRWSYLLYKRISDADRLSWIKQHLREGMVVLDIGANIGDYLPLLSKLVGPTGKVYAFEPDPTNFAYMKRYSGHLQNVVLENAAVGEQDGTIKLFQSEELNVDHQTFDSGEARKFIEVPCVSLDTYLKDHHVDLIKVDIQGFDFFAIKGAKQILTENAEIAIIGEFWPYAMQKAGYSTTEYLNFIKSFGFEVELDPKALTEDVLDNKDYYTDFIATKHGTKDK